MSALFRAVKLQDDTSLAWLSPISLDLTAFQLPELFLFLPGVPDCCLSVLGLVLLRSAHGCNVPRWIWTHPRLCSVPTGDTNMNGVSSFCLMKLEMQVPVLSPVVMSLKLFPILKFHFYGYYLSL